MTYTFLDAPNNQAKALQLSRGDHIHVGIVVAKLEGERENHGGSNIHSNPFGSNHNICE